MRMIVIEGVDRVGKSTLADMLSAELNIPVIHDDYINDDMGSQYVNVEKMRSIIAFAKQSHTDFISDRFHWSEAVYGVIERNHPNVDLVQALDTMMHDDPEIDVLVIWVQSQDIKMSSAEHGKDLVKHEDTFNLLYEYTHHSRIKCTYGELRHATVEAKRWFNEIERRSSDASNVREDQSI